ncbi:hypothetical protein GCM10027051_08380 [Niabella terrae]
MLFLKYPSSVLFMTRATILLISGLLFQLIAVAQTKPANVTTIIVDAGHGGPDGGARGTLTNEATITLAVSQKLAKALRDSLPELKILETRPGYELPGGLTNPNTANRLRADFANQHNGDLFISLHCNAAGRRPGGWYTKKVVGRQARTRYVKKGKKRVKQTYYVNRYDDVWVENKAKGTETYIWAVGKNDQKISSLRQMSQEEQDGDYYDEGASEDSTGTDELQLPDPNDPAEKARLLIYAQHYFRKSYALATLVEKEFVGSGRTSRGVQQRNHKGIWVLQATGMPSILVEMGFISNNDDQAYLMSDEGQRKIVENIVNAVKVYLEKYS